MNGFIPGQLCGPNRFKRCVWIPLRTCAGAYFNVRSKSMGDARFRFLPVPTCSTHGFEIFVSISLPKKIAVFVHRWDQLPNASRESIAASVSESHEALQRLSEFKRRVGCVQNWRAQQAGGLHLTRSGCHHRCAPKRECFENLIFLGFLSISALEDG